MLTLAAAQGGGYCRRHNVRLAAAVEFHPHRHPVHDDGGGTKAREPGQGRATNPILWGAATSHRAGGATFLFSRAFQ